jgi:glycosyltransferase involved in cell wall biosynthesis
MRTALRALKSAACELLGEAAWLGRGRRRRLRLLILADSRLGAATLQARGKRFVDIFRENGWFVLLVDTVHVTREHAARLARRYDIVYFLKVADLPLYEAIRSCSRAKLVFDLTDALWRPPHDAVWPDLNRILGLVDGVIGNNGLDTAYARRFNRRVYLVPPSSPVKLFDAAVAARRPREGGKVRIGWVGGWGTRAAVEVVRPVLERIGERHPEVELRLLGCEPVKIGRLRCTALPEYDEPTMVREIVDLDIGLFPPPGDLEDYCVRGALKAILYMSGRVPPVCQATGDCVDLIRDGENGMLAGTPEEWERKISSLVSNHDLRRALGRAAYETVRKEYSVANVFAQAEQAFFAIHASPSGNIPL